MGNSQNGTLFEVFPYGFLWKTKTKSVFYAFGFYKYYEWLIKAVNTGNANSSHLNEIVRLQVDGCRCFVEYEDLGLAEEGARQADQLPLSDTATQMRSRIRLRDTQRHRARDTKRFT